MQKTIKKIATLLAVFMISSLVVGCGSHTHQFEEGWSSDATHHWHCCTKKGCSEVDSKEVHTFGNEVIESLPTKTTTGRVKKVCLVCGYEVYEDIELSGLFAGGTGVESDPFLISSPYNLNGISLATKAGVFGAYFRLTNDIDMTGKPWTPIGEGGYRVEESSYTRFEGTIDGCGYTIKGLSVENYTPSSDLVYKIERDSRTGEITEDHTGHYSLGFVAVCKNSVIKNVKLENVNFDTSVGDCVGGIVGASYGGLTIQNCQVKSGVISGIDCVAGIVGKAYSLTENDVLVDSPIKISECVNYANVSGKTRAGGIGGSVSFRCGTELIDCENYGTIKAESASNGGAAGMVANLLFQTAIYIDNNVLQNYKEHSFKFVNCTNFGSLYCESGIVRDSDEGVNQLAGFWGNCGTIEIENCFGKIGDNLVKAQIETSGKVQTNLSSFLGYGQAIVKRQVIDKSYNGIHRVVLDKQELFVFFANSGAIFGDEVGLNIVQADLTNESVAQMYGINEQVSEGSSLEGYNDGLWHIVVNE